MQECVITVIAIITAAIMRVKQWVKIFYTIVKILSHPLIVKKQEIFRNIKEIIA